MAAEGDYFLDVNKGTDYRKLANQERQRRISSRRIFFFP
jgi:hypothetical protein